MTRIALDQPDDKPGSLTPGSHGRIASYIHHDGMIGVLVDLRCESDFIARSDGFQELLKDLALHIAASDPLFISKDELTPEMLEVQRKIYSNEAIASGKPPDVMQKIAEGKMSKYPGKVCVMEQPFVKEPAITVMQLLERHMARTGEKIHIPRFVRFEIERGESAAG